MSNKPNVLVLHGPNLNMTGFREPDLYGKQPLSEIDEGIKETAEELGLETRILQSNHEGALIDRIQASIGEADGLIINPGGLTHTSVSLRDALAATDLPVIEVHISNVFARESFRHVSMVSGIATGVITGVGTAGYRLALRALVDHQRA